MDTLFRLKSDTFKYLRSSIMYRIHFNLWELHVNHTLQHSECNLCWTGTPREHEVHNKVPLTLSSSQLQTQGAIRVLFPFKKFIAQDCKKRRLSWSYCLSTLGKEWEREPVICVCVGRYVYIRFKLVRRG